MTTRTRTARLTGLAYLGLAVSGMLSFLLIRQMLFAPDDAGETSAAGTTGRATVTRISSPSSSRSKSALRRS